MQHLVLPANSISFKLSSYVPDQDDLFKMNGCSLRIWASMEWNDVLNGFESNPRPLYLYSDRPSIPYTEFISVSVSISGYLSPHNEDENKEKRKRRRDSFNKTYGWCDSLGVRAFTSRNEKQLIEQFVSVPFSVQMMFLIKKHSRSKQCKVLWSVWVDSNLGPLVSEVTTLPTVPQPLPYD